jgi:hypothetical protein
MFMIEVTVAIVILTVALLALMAGYDSAFISMHKSTQQETAATLANQQLELYRALPYDAIGLDETVTDSVGDSNNPAYDETYTDNSLLDGDVVPDPSNPDQTITLPSGVVNENLIEGCGGAANCLPIQTVTGSDNKQYRIETYVRDRLNATGISRYERVVTVVVQNAELDSLPTILTAETAFDSGP